MDLKRKHHYVPQFYLSGWSNEKKKIHVLIKNKIMPLKTKEILFETDFHKLPVFSDKQIDFFWDFLCKPYLQFENHAMKSSIKNLSEILDKELNFKMRFMYFLYLNPDFYNGMGDLSSKLLNDCKTIIRQLDEYRFNLIEDYFSGYESKWGDVLRKIKSNELIGLDYQDYEDLCTFCAFTLCRTQYMRNKQRDILQKVLHDINIYMFNDNEFDDLIFIFLTFIIPVQLSNGFVNEKIIFTVIHNKTDLNLITNDNPVRNVRFRESATEFLIPISPMILLKGEIINNKNMISYLKQQFKDDVDIMRKWTEENQDIDNVDIPLTKFPKSTGKSIYDLLLFETEWSDTNKIMELNNYMNNHKNQYIIGKQKSDLEPFVFNQGEPT